MWQKATVGTWCKGYHIWFGSKWFRVRVSVFPTLVYISFRDENKMLLAFQDFGLIASYSLKV